MEDDVQVLRAMNLELAREISRLNTELEDTRKENKRLKHTLQAVPTLLANAGKKLLDEWNYYHKTGEVN